MLDQAGIDSSAIEQCQAFRDTFRALERRIKIVTALPVASLDRLSLAREVQAIGRIRPGEAL